MSIIYDLRMVFCGRFNFRRIIQSQNIICDGSAYFEELVVDTITSTSRYGQYSRAVNDAVILYPRISIKYVENGFLLLEGKQHDFHQSRIFKIEDNQLKIFKSDQNLLHSFSLDEDQKFPIKLLHLHKCKDDRYLLNMNIINKNEFYTIYTINGKQKDYIIETLFTRH